MTRATRLLSGLVLLWISGAVAAVAEAPADKSLAVSYGPSEQVQFFLTRKEFGLYTQPIITFSSRSNDFGTSGFRELGARYGLFFGFTALTYRQLECRLLAGAGGHYVYRDQTIKNVYGPSVHLENRQYAAEIWIQPEFRFFSRFAIILQPQALRYIWETDESDSESTRADFDTPNLSLSELRVGFRYYFPLRP